MRLVMIASILLPVPFGLAPQSGAGHGRVDNFATVEGGEAAAELLVEFGQLRGTRGVVALQKPHVNPGV
jgi:hypothetical protein